MVSNSVYYHKYQKYKHKYLKLNQYGGTIIEDLSQLKDGLTSIIFKINQKLVPGLFPNSLQSITAAMILTTNIHHPRPFPWKSRITDVQSTSLLMVELNSFRTVPQNLKKLEFGEYFGKWRHTT